MSKTRKFRASIKHVFDPAMRDLGFEVAYPTYRRIAGEIVDLVDLSHGKYGGGFQIEFARQKGPFHDWNNVIIPPQKLETIHISFLLRARLCDPSKDKARNAKDFFDYSQILDDRDALDALVIRVTGYLPQMEAWFVTGKAGPNVASF